MSDERSSGPAGGAPGPAPLIFTAARWIQAHPGDLFTPGASCAPRPPAWAARWLAELAVQDGWSVRNASELATGTRPSRKNGDRAGGGCDCASTEPGGFAASFPTGWKTLLRGGGT